MLAPFPHDDDRAAAESFQETMFLAVRPTVPIRVEAFRANHHGTKSSPHEAEDTYKPLALFRADHW